MREEIYLAPEVEVSEFVVEKGFEGSTEELSPSGDRDGNGFWF